MKVGIVTFLCAIVLLTLTCSDNKSEKLTNYEISKGNDKLLINTWNGFFAKHKQTMESESNELENTMLFIDSDGSLLITTIWKNRESYGSMLEIHRVLSMTGSNPKIVNVKNIKENNFELSKISGNDINNDGKKEIVVEHFNGGNCWKCSWIEIFQQDNGNLKKLAIPIYENISPYELVDLNSDNVYEILAVDTEWEMYGDFCHACSPSDDVIFSWNGTQYSESSIKFSSYYDQRIEIYKAKLNDCIDSAFDDNYYAGDVINLLLNYIRKGEIEQGFQNCEKYARILREKNSPMLATYEDVTRILRDRCRVLN